jgi:hypothetical protein
MTTKTPRKPRFSSMEVLGFIETPATTYDSRMTWVETTSEIPVVAVEDPTDPLSSWRPEEFGARLLGRGIRWGMVLAVTALLLATAVAAMWVYRRPAVEAARAREAVAASASALLPDLGRLVNINSTLDAAEINASEVNSVILAVDGGVRGLFEAAGGLTPEDAGMRTRLIAASGDISDAVRRFSDAYSFRSAVIPALAAPTLLTDPDMVSLEEAASAFSEWQAHYESLRNALPENLFREVADAMSALSANLTGYQRLYLDALADGDGDTASAAIARIETDLDEIERLLFANLSTTSVEIAEGLTDAEDVLRDTLSLLG